MNKAFTLIKLIIIKYQNKPKLIQLQFNNNLKDQKNGM